MYSQYDIEIIDDQWSIALGFVKPWMPVLGNKCQWWYKAWYFDHRGVILNVMVIA